MTTLVDFVFMPIEIHHKSIFVLYEAADHITVSIVLLWGKENIFLIC